MKQAIIPWRTFWDGVKIRGATEPADWLARWSFTDAGVTPLGGAVLTISDPASSAKTRAVGARQDTAKFDSLALISLRLASAFAVGTKPKSGGHC